MPVSCPVGMWRCVVDTCTIEDPSSRLQYRSDQDVYVIFNPFSKGSQHELFRSNLYCIRINEYI